MSRPVYSPQYSIPCYSNTWWLGRRFECITWFGTIRFRCGRDELERKLQSPAMLRTERHEHIHMLQAQSFRTRYVGFYLAYLCYWLRNVLRYRSAFRAYCEIPFEREAYANEHFPDYSVTRWRSYRF